MDFSENIPILSVDFVNHGGLSFAISYDTQYCGRNQFFSLILSSNQVSDSAVQTEAQ